MDNGLPGSRSYPVMEQPGRSYARGGLFIEPDGLRFRGRGRRDALRWDACLDGCPQLAEAVYSWQLGKGSAVNIRLGRTNR
jgi:hypothetical protein